MKNLILILVTMLFCSCAYYEPGSTNNSVNTYSTPTYSYPYYGYYGGYYPYYGYYGGYYGYGGYGYGGWGWGRRCW